ncbi:hypothetical protein [Methanobrevibacter curvatus]|uniref:Uncharacterized protein n=1 Tax=Methanobrevibacter curvatus TaxID=49547 RepID=A0A166CB41_9EURY|nr:hypothetical protein [Methanobrevibacter curvatus]KZX14322.1 hypothetical protein MBCUR_05460 [Methanobrevibacter curvatus]
MSTEFYHSKNKTNNYTKKEISSDWDIKNDWNKISVLNFSTNENLDGADHVKLRGLDINNFGGQIVDFDKSYNDLNTYNAYDYRRYLQTEVTYKPTGYRRSSDIVKNLLKKYVINSNTPISLKASNTPSKDIFVKLIWENVTILRIINELIYLEFINGTLIDYGIDDNGTITYKPLPAQMNIPVITEAIDGSYSVDYSDIQTSLRVDGLLVKENKELVNLWGTINKSVNVAGETDKKDDEILKIVKTVNLRCRQFNYSANGPHKYKEAFKAGKCSDKGMSELIYHYLSIQSVPVRISRYRAGNRDHDSVLVYYKNKWQDFLYSGMNKNFKATSASKKGRLIK